MIAKVACEIGLVLNSSVDISETASLLPRLNHSCILEVRLHRPLVSVYTFDKCYYDKRKILIKRHAMRCDINYKK